MISNHYRSVLFHVRNRPFEPKFWLNKGDWITCNAVQMSKNRLRCAVKYKHFSPAMLYTTVTLYFLAYDWPQQSSFCSDTSHRLLCLKLHFSIALALHIGEHHPSEIGCKKIVKFKFRCFKHVLVVQGQFSHNDT